MHPWDDPTLMPRYQVQVETRDTYVSYDVVSLPGQAAGVALNHFRTLDSNARSYAWIGGITLVGYAPAVAAPGLALGWNISPSPTKPDPKE
jgi:hypothetical protein